MNSENNSQTYPPLEWLKHLKPRETAKILTCGMRLFSRPKVAQGGLTHETIYWRAVQGGWTSVRWVTVTEYSLGLIRLRNDVEPSIPKHVWPLPFPETRHFELTFHESEITEELGEPLFAFCSAMGEAGVILGWPLFEGEQTYPGYAWTRKAKEFYNANHQRGLPHR